MGRTAIVEWPSGASGDKDIKAALFSVLCTDISHFSLNDDVVEISDDLG